MAWYDWDTNDHGASEVCPAHWKEGGKKTNLKVIQLRNWDYFAAFDGQDENGNANGTKCARRLAKSCMSAENREMYGLHDTGHRSPYYCLDAEASKY